MNITIKMDGLQDTIKKLQDISAHKVPKVAAMALTATAKEFKKTITDMMPQVFDRPTPWIQRGMYLTWATPNNLSISVGFKDAQKDVIEPHVYGGGRKLKRSETALQSFGRMSAGNYTVPGGGVRLNQYGNISSGQYAKILTAARALRGMSDTKFYGRRGGYKLRAGTTDLFIGRPGGKPLGVWERYGAKRQRVRPILIFINKQPQYKKRLPFYETAQRIVQPIFRREFIRLADETIQFNKNK